MGRRSGALAGLGAAAGALLAAGAAAQCDPFATLHPGQAAHAAFQGYNAALTQAIRRAPSSANTGG